MHIDYHTQYILFIMKQFFPFRFHYIFNHKYFFTYIFHIYINPLSLYIYIFIFISRLLNTSLILSIYLYIVIVIRGYLFLLTSIQTKNNFKTYLLILILINVFNK